MDFILGACIFGAFIVGSVIGALYMKYSLERSATQKVPEFEQTELFFFPDATLPCRSYFKTKTSNRFVRCTKNQCDYFHSTDLQKSSLIRLIESLANARQIDLCIFRFTLERVAEIFIYLKSRGVRIRIIADNPRETVDNNQIPKLKEQGIEVREEKLVVGAEDRSRPLMHNKFVIIDKKCCLLGSFNWTFQAVTKNHETLLKSYDPLIVEQLSRKFESMWRKLGPPPKKTNH